MSCNSNKIIFFIKTPDSFLFVRSKFYVIKSWIFDVLSKFENVIQIDNMFGLIFRIDFGQSKISKCWIRWKRLESSQYILFNINPICSTPLPTVRPLKWPPNTLKIYDFSYFNMTCLKKHILQWFLVLKRGLFCVKHLMYVHYQSHQK